MRFTPLFKTSAYKARYLFILLFAICFSSSVFALLVPMKDKLVQVRPSSEALSVTIQPIKTSFWVNEKIRLRSKGNKPYYLYLFNVDPQTGKAIMILPNKLQPDNYYSQQAYIVPNRNVEFYSDRPGTEQMIMVASRKALNVDTSRYQSIGDFASGNSAQFEKSLGVRFNAPKQQKTNPDIVVKSFNIKVQGERQVEQSSFIGQLFGTSETVEDNSPVAFVSTAKNEYVDGEQFNLVFGANQKGYVHLYAIDPLGAYDLLKVVAVDGKSIQSLKIAAAPPYGRHTLIALFDNNQIANNKIINTIELNADKSLYVVKESTRAVAVHPIYIKVVR